ncbi:RF-C (Ctf18p) AAA+ ATpase [Cryptosporidium xiaoi]|uniref:RF-C (Ctf18p) AAA+ ATpase n=1 Tax=Cryptosporidium xiaoi TaxID=659607 RepID=A0AAV9XXS3_9CRYT
MWDLEKDWSDDEAFGFNNSRKKNVLKSKRDANNTTKIVNCDQDLNNSRPGDKIIVNNDIENDYSVNKFSSSSKMEDNISICDRNLSNTMNKRKKTECSEDLKNVGKYENPFEAKPYSNSSSIDNIYNDNCYKSHVDTSFLDFDDYYTTFGLNSLKFVGNNKKIVKNNYNLKNRSNKLLVDLVQEIATSLDSENNKGVDKEIFKFNGVYDNSKTFFVKGWDPIEIQDNIEMCLNQINSVLYDKEHKKNDFEMNNAELNIELNKNINMNELNADLNDIKFDYCNDNKNLRIKREMLTKKYIPKSCLDLVNDEDTVRNILRWIKQWDEYVFGSEKKKNNLVNDFNENLNGNPDIDENKLPPSTPILLIGGPSGSGKTCIVNTLAKQCGYDINQIKISDEKIIDNFENSIRMGINYSKIGNYSKLSSNKPNIILIDELDSITLNSGNTNSTSGDSKVLSSKKGNKLDFLVKLVDDHAKTRNVINRPIICICNDIYNKSIRLLKSKVTTILVQKPPKDKLIKRLKRICKYEKILLEDDEILSEIIRIHDADIRSCLNSIYIMCQKECDSVMNNNKGITDFVKIYWEDLEDCCYTKDAEQDASLFIKLCFGLEDINAEHNQEYTKSSNKLKNNSFISILNYGDEVMLNFGQGLVGLLTENIYRCNLMSDFYFDYIKIILDSVSEYNVISSKANTLTPFLQTSILVSKKIMGLHCNQFRHLGVSTYTYSQQVNVQNNNIYKDISDSSIDSLRPNTLTLAFKIYTLPSILTHFNDINYLKYLSIWKSANTIPKLKNIIKNKLDLISDKEELDSLLLLFNIISKMKCYGFKFSQDCNTSGDKQFKYSKKRNNNSISTHIYCNYSQIEPNIFSLYSLKCLNNSVDTGYIRNPVFEPLKLGHFIYDRGYYTLINQLIDYFGDEIATKITNFHFNKNEGETHNFNKKDNIDLKLKDNLIVPTFDELLTSLNKDENNTHISNIRAEKKAFHCIYQFNDGFINAVKMDVRLSDLIL